MMKKQQILVSSDSIGFLGGENEFLFLWKDYFDKGLIDGVEMIGLRPIFKAKKFIKKLKEKNIKTISIHGRLGIIKDLSFIKKIFLQLVDFFIFTYEELIKNFPEQEFLFHSFYLKNKSIQKQILKNPPKVLWIENSFTSRDFKELDDTLNLVNFFRKNKIKCFGMLDLYHALSFNDTQEIIDNWFKLLGKLKKYLKYFSGIHLPIGPRLDDSLPIDFLDEEKIDFLKKEILFLPSRIVIENSQHYPALLFSTRQMLEKQKKRNKKIIEKLNLLQK